MASQIERDGAELNTLAGYLFTAAARLWWGGRALEMGASFVALVFGVAETDSWWAALLPVVCLGVGYALRLMSADKYDTAETMKRQSVFSEGLAWPVSPLQLSEWRRKAGRANVARLATEPRDVDYYATNLLPGPGRLVSIVRESAFYTRHVYIRLRHLAVVSGSVMVVALLVVAWIVANREFPTDVSQIVARTIILAVPMVFVADFLGIALHLSRLISTIKDVEQGLGSLSSASPEQTSEALRLVSEYHCQTVSGTPALPYLWRRWHDQIKGDWDAMERMRTADAAQHEE